MLHRQITVFPDRPSRSSNPRSKSRKMTAMTMTMMMIAMMMIRLQHRNHCPQLLLNLPRPNPNRNQQRETRNKKCRINRSSRPVTNHWINCNCTSILSKKPSPSPKWSLCTQRPPLSNCTNEKSVQLVRLCSRHSPSFRSRIDWLALF